MLMLRESLSPLMNLEAGFGGAQDSLSWAIQTQEKTLDRILDAVHAADGKASAIIATDVAMIAALVALGARPGGGEALSAYWIALGSTLLIVSLVLVALVTFPRLTGPPGSLVFFGAISTKSALEYTAAVTCMEPAGYLADLNTQCHRNATIAAEKYRWIRLAAITLILGVAPWLVSLFLIIRG